jgi:hypothetical protein
MADGDEALWQGAKPAGKADLCRQIKARVRFIQQDGLRLHQKNGEETQVVPLALA